MNRLCSCVCLAFAIAECFPICGARATGAERWFMYQPNLSDAAEVEAAVVLWRRAAQVGYTHVLVDDTRFSRLGKMPPRYFQGITRLRTLAAKLNLEVVPSVFPMGYSNPLLWNDPNLIEAMPARDALLVVTNGVASLQQDPPVSFPRGGFADLGLWTFKDSNVVSEAGSARVTDPHQRYARIAQKINVSPFRQYHISVRIKTQDFRGTPQVRVLAGTKDIMFNYLNAKSTQNSTLHHIVFNSQDNRELFIYFGSWGGSTGSVWWDDPMIEEVAFVNLVRRDGAPLVVKRQDGAVLIEGKDFEPLIDARLGVSGARGYYDFYHPPPLLRAALPDGTRLRVSSYHAATVHGDQAVICLSEPKTMKMLRDQASRLHAAWGARGYFMWHDEMRVLNWCDACQRRNLDAGALLADNVRACAQILREVNPGGRIYVWSDMFDPNHNAQKEYYLVRGDLTGSWEGLDKDIIVVPWYIGYRDVSLKFFADRGYRQLIAGYYDSPPEHVREWLTSAERFPNIDGVMYTTWHHNYTDLEAFSQIVETFQSKAVERHTGAALPREQPRETPGEQRLPPSSGPGPQP